MIQPPERRTLPEVARLLRGMAGLPSLALAARTLPRGHGEPVLVLPGFMTSDVSTVALRRFLSRLGYAVHGWGLGTNHGDVRRLLPLVGDRLAEVHDAVGQPVRLVGWSLGGLLARGATRAHPERVDRIVTLGTPVRGGPKYTLAAPYYEERGFDLDAIERQVAEVNSETLPRPITAIYSRVDGVVAWRACIDDNTDNDVVYVELDVGHLELGFSAPVFRAVAGALAEPRGRKPTIAG